MDSKEPYDQEDKELLEIIGRPTVVPNVALQANAKFLRKSFDKLTESINKNSTSSDKLSKRILWLTFIITIATVLGVALSIYQFIKQ